MKRTSMMLAAFAFSALALASAGAMAQPASTGGEPNAKAVGTVKEGGTTIEFQSAGTNQSGMEPFKIWSDFAAQHPKIARDLGNKPSLTRDAGYLKKNPELDSFFSAHPDIRDSMNENPGNFVVPSSGTAE